ncbi:hypothetical protein [Clostridium senegalense]|uniref:hypothetical protein n=1 Tax=Clostridium senegalense TaxID=1465809 RepID=UPI001FAE395C|nr:hypothetical protein [Clostridium senegalense]
MIKTRKYVEYLFKNYNEILKNIVRDGAIECLSFSLSNNEKIITINISDKSCKIALIYNEATKRMNKESREEIYKMLKLTEFEITRLNYCIEQLENKIKEVIKEIFIEKLSWSQTCKKYSIN